MNVSFKYELEYFGKSCDSLIIMVGDSCVDSGKDLFFCWAVSGV